MALRFVWWLVWALVLFGWFDSSGQFQLAGTIRDVQTKTGLPGTSIYFPELLRGAASGAEGQFVVPNLPAGRFLVQVSHVGYETQFIQISIRRDSTFDFELKPSLIQMQEVVVRGIQSESPSETSFNIAQVSQVQMVQSGSISVSDAMARLPGVSQLTTGPGISKPVIRGLYGNRIQVTVNGIRFDNQQWQDEHGLGLSDIGVDRVEVIRGPASVLYGSDAMGGVMNVIDEKPAPVNTEVRDLSTRFYSNTYGISVNYGIKKSTAERWKKLRMGIDNHADYSDGNNQRVLNSRFASYNLKASWGRNKDNATHVTNVTGSYSLFGFVFDSLTVMPEDSRLSRKFSGPHHMVGFGQVTSEHTYYRQNKKIKFNSGFISNLRLEDEGGGGISLSMLLNTLNVLGQVTRPVGSKGEWTYGSSLMFQTNTNFGGRIIVPNAITGEASAFTFYKHQVNQLLLEGGVRYDFKFIKTFATSTLNSPGGQGPFDEVHPFSNVYNAFNVSGGLGYMLFRPLVARLNVSTGYRPGNLAELSSNGLHEGTLRWEIGLPNAKLEQNLNVEGSLIFNASGFRATASYYRNRFHNFFYLAATGLEYYGFGIYRYDQSDATLRGGEMIVEWSPGAMPIDFTLSYNFIEAKKDDGSYLPFIPANRFQGEIRLHLKSSATFMNPIIRLGGSVLSDQNHSAEFETPTPGYYLLNAGLTTTWKNKEIWLAGTNLLNEYYFDHLSRYKNYGIANMGRNIIVGVNFKL